MTLLICVFRELDIPHYITVSTGIIPFKLYRVVPNGRQPAELTSYLGRFCWLLISIFFYLNQCNLALDSSFCRVIVQFCCLLPILWTTLIVYCNTKQFTPRQCKSKLYTNLDNDFLLSVAFVHTQHLHFYSDFMHNIYFIFLVSYSLLLVIDFIFNIFFNLFI